jgi:predicted metal-dependent HD superfamily phosphohydrolase
MSENILVLVTDAYTEPHRYYHNLNHIMRMFSYAKENNIPLNKKQKLAIWFHDISYNPLPKKKSDEETSADLAYIMLYKELGRESANVVKQMILDTTTHHTLNDDSKTVVDLDLIDLAFKDRYIINGENIRKEFSHLTDEQFKEGRIKWLESFINRKTIYLSKYCQHLNERAKANLTLDLIELKK